MGLCLETSEKPQYAIRVFVYLENRVKDFCIHTAPHSANIRDEFVARHAGRPPSAITRIIALGYQIQLARRQENGKEGSKGWRGVEKLRGEKVDRIRVN
jgi:hypothetical protein